MAIKLKLGAYSTSNDKLIFEIHFKHELITGMSSALCNFESSCKFNEFSISHRSISALRAINQFLNQIINGIVYT